MAIPPPEASKPFNSERWARLCAQLGARNPLPSVDQIAAAYNDPPRPYHNASHILDCLEQFDAFVQTSSDSFVSGSTIENGSLSEVETALWFHDIVYDPRAKDNEEQSVHYMEGLLREAQVPQPAVERIGRLIMATRHQSTPDSLEAALITDIDLSILGRGPDRFEAYDQAIREEYDWVPLEDYRKGRAKVLTQFLERKPLFQIAFFREKFENQAKINLAKKIRELEHEGPLDTTFPGLAPSTGNDRA